MLIVRNWLLARGATDGSIDATNTWNASQNLIEFEIIGQENEANAPTPMQFIVGCHPIENENPWFSSAAEADVWIETSNSLGEWHTDLDNLWLSRLTPFERNLRLGRRAPRLQSPALVEYESSWPDQAILLINRLVNVAGPSIYRIDHVGSTSVPGLASKDLIDIQIVVDGPAGAFRILERATEAGFVSVAGSWFGKSYSGEKFPEHVVVDADPGRPVNVNIRDRSMPIWRATLLLRDFLRAHDNERDAYAKMKLEFAARVGTDIDSYGADKMPWIFAALARANDWSEVTNWTP